MRANCAGLMPGDYTGYIAECVATESKNGNPMLVLTIAIDLPNGARETIKNWVVLTVPNVVDEFVRAVCPERITIWEQSHWNHFGDFEPSEFVGIELKFQVVMDTWNGREVPKVGRLYPA